jgi:cytosine/adenosine deaminase-related metal-dependent hydrolase
VIRPRSQRHLLVRGGRVVTQDSGRRVLEADVLITEGRIALVGRDISPPSPSRLLDARAMVVIPGLIQPRALLGGALLRGVNHSGEVAHDDETAFWAGRIGAVECLMQGVTVVAGIEMAQGMEGMRRGLVETGIRFVSGRAHDGGTDAFSRPQSDASAWLDGVTRGNASVVGRDAELGSLEPGKAGDLVVLQVQDPRVYSHPDAAWPERILWSLNRGSIRWVVVDGEVLVDDSRLPHLDLETWTQPAQDAARKLLKRGKGI